MRNSFLFNKKNNFSLFKVIVPGVLLLIVVFSLFLISNNKSVIDTLARLVYGDNEVELDNWEISTVFYDSTVNDGKTPLTEINWDASDGGYGKGETRTITVEIYYKNVNPVVNYKKGDIFIKIPALVQGKSQDYVFWTPLLDVRKNVGANDSSHSGYDWNYTFSNNTFTFTNNNEISVNAPLEGSIQISYVMTPRQEDSNGWEEATIEKYDSTCLHKYSNSINAKMNNTIESNYVSFDYQRTYTHEWSYSTYTIAKSVQKINSYDLPYKLTRQIDDYYWVKYMFNTSYSSYNNYLEYYPYVTKTELLFEDIFPPGTLVYSVNNDETVTLNNGRMYYPIKLNKLTLYDRARSSSAYFIVGYKKSEIDSTLIDNIVKMYANYDDGNNDVFLSESSISFDLNDYVYTPFGDLFSLRQFHDNNDGKLFYRYLTNREFDHYCGYDFKGHPTNYFRYGIEAHTTYTGKDMTIELGGDLIYISDSENSYRRLNENEYNYVALYTPYVYNGEGQELTVELDLYVRSENTDSFELYKTVKSGNKEILLPSELNVVEYYYKTTTDVSMVFKNSNTSVRMQLKIKGDIAAPSGKIYTYNYLKVFEENSNGDLVLKNKMTSDDYNEFVEKQSIIDYDLKHNGDYIQRATSFHTYDDSPATIQKPQYEASKQFISNTVVQDASQELFIGKASSSIIIDNGGYYYSFSPDKEIDYLKKTIGEDYRFKIGKMVLYELLPEGMELYSTKEEIEQNITVTDYASFFTMDGDSLFESEKNANKFFRDHLNLQIIKNYKNTNRTMLVYEYDLLEEEFILFTEFLTVKSTYKYSISYDELINNGNKWTSYIYTKVYDLNNQPIGIKNRSIKDNGFYDVDVVDLNNNGDTNESFSYNNSSITISSVFSTNQDLQVSVQSNKSNFNIGTVDASVDSDYTYKLRVRTGTNDITNLVIYDSLEKYAKDPNMEFVSASGTNRSWQGTFLGVDTSYAESKGYNVKVYYSEKVDPGNLKNDDSWKLYTDSVDKSKVKSLAFEYLDNEGNPAVLPMNSLTYVLIKMKSPTDENLKTLAYNGCWTEWNAIDSVTGETVDFVTGINSNIVKVALPNSVEPVDIDLEINKYWVDANNKLGKRPQSINVQLVPNDDITKAIDVPLSISNVVSGNSKRWKTTISVPKYDEDGNTITYTVREDEIVLEDGYKYTPSIDNNNVTNTLMKEIELKKIWKDNNNSNLTRPGSVTYILKQNGNDYKEVVVTGDYSTNEWIKKLTVPVYDSSNREYTYTVEEVNVDGYGSNCEDFVCTNTLNGNKNITITKEWNDKNNEYLTRPDSVNIKIKQNGNDYKTITVTGNGNIWNYNITEVPIYDDNGVKYNYTILEDNVDEYGLVEYDQNNYKITNTLKKKINLVIKKIWVDDNNSNNTRPDELTITLLRDDESYKTITLSGDTNEWVTTVEVEKYADDLHKYTYSIKEINDSIKDEYSDVTYSEDDLSVTNKLNKNTDLTVSKKWIDQDNKYLTRPNSVSINLLQNGNLFRELNITKDNNWKEIVKDVPMYDENGAKYNYTIVENNVDTKYGNITYDQTNLEVTNELTEEPKVTLYFTVVNGYVDPVTGEMKYDDFGFSEVLKKHNLDPEKEYTFKFLLENTDTNKKYEGKLSTHGILEFKDIPYGTYKAVESDDIVFEFFDMMSIENVNGVTFKKEGKTGYITINPTGEDIIYGAKIINKIKALISNPKTIRNLVYVVVCLLISYFVIFLFYKNIIFYKR